MFDAITVRDFRCFHGHQDVKLTPLTLLVGENSTGKTSFMALSRALWDVAYRHRVPNFKEEPYDLGSYDEIANHRGGRAGRADTFAAGFRFLPNGRRAPQEPFVFDVEFARRGTAPFPTRRRLSHGDTAVTATQLNGGAPRLKIESRDESWEEELDHRFETSDDGNILEPLYLASFLLTSGQDGLEVAERSISAMFDAADMYRPGPRPFASAPVRSKPKRTYDPNLPSRDPEGDYVPMYLAEVFRQQSVRNWEALRGRLEAFGKASELFDEISIKLFGPKSQPFHIQIRKFGKRLKGPQRNLIDVGYGISQVLPLITELLRPDTLRFSCSSSRRSISTPWRRRRWARFSARWQARIANS